MLCAQHALNSLLRTFNLYAPGLLRGGADPLTGSCYPRFTFGLKREIMFALTFSYKPIYDDELTRYLHFYPAVLCGRSVLSGSNARYDGARRYGRRSPGQEH